MFKKTRQVAYSYPLSCYTTR